MTLRGADLRFVLPVVAQHVETVGHVPEWADVLGISPNEGNVGTRLIVATATRTKTTKSRASEARDRPVTKIKMILA